MTIVLALLITLGVHAMAHAQPASAGRELKVTILLGASGRGDKGFNDNALAGLDAARKRGPLTVVERAAPAPDAYAAVIDEVAAEAPDLIIGVGFLYAEPFRAASPRHPARRFLLLDVELS